jgi:hypothetical protein
MALDHLFGTVHANLSTLDRKWWRNVRYAALMDAMDTKVTIHDDLLAYVNDALAWIPCYNPLKGMRHFGLNTYGITVIAGQSAKIATQIFNAWAGLFKLAPSRLVLTGRYELSARFYQKLRLDRDAVVAKFSALAASALEVEHSNGETFMLHLGI